MDVPTVQDLVFDEDPVDGVLYGGGKAAPPANVIEMCARGSGISEESAVALASVLACHQELALDAATLEAAEATLRQAISKAEVEGEASGLKAAKRAVGLANLLKATGRLGKAEGLYRYALDIQVRELGRGHEDAVRTMERLANVLDLQGMRQQAAEMRVRCAIEDMFRKGDQESLLNVRSIALELFRAGDYARAEEIYRRLLERRFEPSSTCCHLARVLTMCDREQEARSALTQGWKMRVGALPYVSARILFFRLVFALLDGEDGRQQLECIKHLLKQVNVHHIWIMEPVITHLERRLTADKIELLQALVAALSERKNLPMLEALDQWRKPNSRTGAVC